MPRQITVTTGARLHFGLLSHQPTRGRYFGGVGLMVDQPGFRITARLAERDSASGPEAALRVRRFLETYRSHGPADRLPPCHLTVEREIPAHAGLGSGTQLGMAVAQALALMAGEGHVDAPQLAARVGRGLRSALGIYGFARGGLLVDGGKLSEARIAPLAARAAFPDDWRMVLVTPGPPTGLSGAAERRAFAELPSMPMGVTSELSRLVLLELLPAVLEADFDACGEALFEIGRQVGEYFAPVQGGVYADAAMRQLAIHVRRSGIRGVGQSSWGPTMFILCQSATDADELTGELSRDDRWSACRFRIASPMNTGAVLEFPPAN